MGCPRRSARNSWVARGPPARRARSRDARGRAIQPESSKPRRARGTRKTELRKSKARRPNQPGQRASSLPSRGRHAESREATARPPKLPCRLLSAQAVRRARPTLGFAGPSRNSVREAREARARDFAIRASGSPRSRLPRSHSSMRRSPADGFGSSSPSRRLAKACGARAGDAAARAPARSLGGQR